MTIEVVGVGGDRVEVLALVAEQAAGPGTSAGGLAGALPSTGSEWLTNVLAPAGVLLLLAGGGALLVSRRRRHA